jgi:nucleoside-diphosphate-sugar epimerase
MGYLGTYCVIELLRKGFRVRATVRDAARSAEWRALVGTLSGVADGIEIVEADLSRDAHWPEAVMGCRYVLHVASPFPPGQPRNADEIVIPAREGTLRVLQASLAANVERVVLTSSMVAMAYPKGQSPEVISESFWSDADHPLATPYIKSKTLAELAAWDLVKSNGQNKLLSVVAPSTVLGPVFGKRYSYSIQSVSRLLNGSVPAIPRLGFAFVDVRDVVDLHLRAMVASEAGGERYLATGDFHWLEEIAGILRSSLGPGARRVPRMRLPDFALKLMAMVDPGIRTVSRELGRSYRISWEKSQRTFGWSPRPFQETVVDCANSLIRVGAV